MTFIDYIASVGSDTARVTAQVCGEPVFILQLNGELILPVELDRNFGLVVTNLTDELRAFPVRVGDGTNWLNLYAECPEIDPSLMPSTGGMWEVRPNRSQAIKAFELPNSGKRPFVAQADGLGYGDIASNLIEVWERPPADPNATLNEEPALGFFGQGFLVGAGSRSTGPVIGAGAHQQGARVVTNLDYLAALPLVTVRIVTRDQATEMLVQAGTYRSKWALSNVRHEDRKDLKVSR